MAPSTLLDTRRTPTTLISELYDQALDSLAARRVKIENTRLSRYQLTLGELHSKDASEIKKSGRLPEFVKCLLEATDVIEAASVNPSYFTDQDSRSKLCEISKGPDYPPIGDQQAKDKARDSQFELVSAAFLQQRSCFAGFSRLGGDILLRHGRCIRPVECKRLSSPQALNGRVREICNRLESDYEKSMPAGVGLIDVSRAALSTDRIVSTRDDDQLIAVADGRLNAFILQHQDVLQKRARIDNAVLGFFLRLVVTGISGRADNIRKATAWQFVNHNPDYDLDHVCNAALFDDLVAGLDKRPVVILDEPIPPLHLALKRFLPERLEPIAYYFG